MRPSGPISLKARRFGESVIREMSRVCARENGINLAQGFPDFPAPQAMKDAACAAIGADVNQYAVTWGSPSLRRAIAERTSAYNGIPTDPDSNVTVCCGATEAMIAALLAVVDPGDEVVIFEPFYENYGPDCILSGATPRMVRLRTPDWGFDPAELRAAFGPRTRAIIVNTPHNPTGKVFTREELGVIADLCQEFGALAITDEIYEYMLYDGAQHVSIATLPGMAERTITISGLSKTWSATGWRVGWCVAPRELTGAIRKVHDFLTVGAPAPLQEAAAQALSFGEDYFRRLSADYLERRDVLTNALNRVGFRVHTPRGAYYAMADISDLTELDGASFAMELVRGGGVAVVPGASFFLAPSDGARLVRFCFAKQLSTLRRAAEVLEQRLGARC